MKGIEVKQGTGDIFFKPIAPGQTLYINPINDPLYAAHRVIHDVLRGTNVTWYAPDYPIRVVGCTQQVSIMVLWTAHRMSDVDQVPILPRED
jgi:hypothetical protein